MQYTIKAGDTLQMVAQKQLGDASLWTDIAQLNNLKYPYVSSTPSDGVVTPGDDIDLPDIGYVSVGTEKPSLGTDLSLLTDNFNLTSGKGGDFSVGLDGDYGLVSEIDCLVQDINHRMMTPMGTLPYHPEYGSNIPNYIGSKKDSNWKIKTELEVSRTIKSDPRMEDVSNITIGDISTGITIDYTGLTQGVVFKPGGVE